MRVWPYGRIEYGTCMHDINGVCDDVKLGCLGVGGLCVTSIVTGLSHPLKDFPQMILLFHHTESNKTVAVSCHL